MNSLSVSDYLVLQPIYSNKEILSIAETAHEEGKKTVLFFIPDCKIRRKLLKYVSIAVFDELQISEVSNVSIDDLASVKTAVLRLYGRGVDTVIVKMNDGETLIFAEERFSLLDNGKANLYKTDIERDGKELKMIVRQVNNCLKRLMPNTIFN